MTPCRAPTPGRTAALRRSRFASACAGLAGVALAMLAGLSPGAASAQDTECMARITGAPGITFRGSGQGYDPFTPREYVEQAQFELENTSDVDCTFEVNLVDERGGRRTLNGPGSNLVYQVVREAGSAVDLPSGPDDVSARGFQVPLRAGQRAVVPYFIRVPAGQRVRPGVHVGNIRINVLPGRGGTRSVLDFATATISCETPSRAEVNLAGTAGGLFEAGRGRYVMDFGTLVQGAERSIFVQVRSTGGFRLAMESENGGKLKLKARGSNQTIDYMATLQDAPITFARRSPVTVMTATSPTPASGASYEFRVRIGDVRGRPAGDYEDIVTITVDPS